MIDRLNRIFNVRTVIFSVTLWCDIIWHRCAIQLILSVTIIFSSCCYKYGRGNHVRVAEEFVTQVTQTDKPNNNTTPLASLLISNQKSNQNIETQEYGVNSLVAFLNHVNRQNAIASKAKQPFEFQFIRDSMASDRGMAWVWFQNKYANSEKYWVITLISINDEWYVDVPICE